MKQITNNKGKLFIVFMFVSFIAFMSSCSGGSGYVPAGNNPTVCSQNLPADMQKLLGCTTQQTQPLPPAGACTAGSIPIGLSVQSYGLGNKVIGASIFLFTSTSNKVTNQTPDITLTSGSTGTATTCLPVGIPFAVKASASGYVDTYQFGEVVSTTDANTLLPVEIMSPTIVNMASGSAGTSQDPTKGAIVGTISDASGNPLSNAVVTLTNIATSATVTTGVFYGAPSLGLPDPTLTATSSVGDYLAFNVSPDAYDVQASDATTHAAIGQSYGEAITGAVSIVNVQP